VSILWTVWDPTYSVYQKSQLQGRDVRVRGKNLYIVSHIRRPHQRPIGFICLQIVQMVAWFSRVATSILITLPQFRPHADYLHLSDIPLSSRSHTYFSALLTLELLVSLSRISNIV
jgi:hypothetical protein